jgi:hypothetical protein
MIYFAPAIVKTYRNWIIAELDSQITDYYRSLIPKAYYVNPPRTKAHVSIVRPFEWPDRPFSQFNGDKIQIRYYLPIRTCGIYFWLDCDCDEIKEIRRKLGLPDYLKNDCYHITLGNTK